MFDTFFDNALRGVVLAVMVFTIFIVAALTRNRNRRWLDKSLPSWVLFGTCAVIVALVIWLAVWMIFFRR